jgi:hypothetical protein
LVKASLKRASKLEEEDSLAFFVEDMGLSGEMFRYREGREERRDNALIALRRLDAQPGAPGLVSGWALGPLNTTYS